METSIFLAGNVWSGGGNNIGEVAFVIGDQNTNKLTHVIIKIGLFDFRLLVADIQQIIHVYPKEQVVQLNLDEDEIKALPPLFERIYAGSPNSEAPEENDISYAEAVERFNRLAQSGLVDEQGRPYEEKWNIPADSYIIRQGADREATGNQFIRIKKVNFDWDSLQILSLTLERSRFLPQEFEVAMEQVHPTNEDWLRRLLENSSFPEQI